MSKPSTRKRSAVTKDKKARSLAIANYKASRSNAKEDSYNSGCHGILSSNTEEELLDSLISDYLSSLKGEKVKVRPECGPTPRGVYVNSPEWNDTPR